MKKRKKHPVVVALEIVVFVMLLAVLAYIVWMGISAGDAQNEPAPTAEPTAEPAPEPTPEPTPEPYGLPDFAPHSVDGTEPERYISTTSVMVDGVIVDEYSSDYEISFDVGEKYTELEGVITFRGNNYRNSPTYGTADVQNKKLQTVWTQNTGTLNDTDGSCWSGNGWVGQPLIVKWPDATRRNIVAMYDWAREKDGLVEVVYAGMDGYIHFYELSTGETTRDAMYVGYTFKGVGALDPRGYPILYLGSGVHSPNGRSRAFIINLVNDTVMYEFGHNENFAYRNWPMFDGSPLVSAETDQLIYPGENGILYIIHLNTNYNETTGELSINPDNVVKWRYNGVRSGGQYWLGMEASPLIINNYIFMADNGGNLMCLDLNTLKLVWVQDTLDDTNCTPVLDIEDGHPYIYISTSFHYGWRSYTTATIPIWKIDAETGEIVWHTDYTCYTVADLSGGVQGTIAVGKNKLSDLIFVPIARTGTASGGVLAALNKETGEMVWEHETSVYSWSSPVDVYDAEGNGYIVYCNCGFNMYFLDGLTGEVLDYMSLGGNIEASPSVYDGYIVVGHRGCRTYCVQIT